MGKLLSIYIYVSIIPSIIVSLVYLWYFIVYRDKPKFKCLVQDRDFQPLFYKSLNQSQEQLDDMIQNDPYIENVSFQFDAFIIIGAITQFIVLYLSLQYKIDLIKYIHRTGGLDPLLNKLPPFLKIALIIKYALLVIGMKFRMKHAGKVCSGDFIEKDHLIQRGEHEYYLFMEGKLIFWLPCFQYFTFIILSEAYMIIFPVIQNRQAIEAQSHLQQQQNQFEHIERIIAENGGSNNVGGLQQNQSNNDNQGSNRRVHHHQD